MNYSEHDILLLVDVPDGLTEPLAPDVLAAIHPGWAVDVERCGPWRAGVGPTGGKAWRAATRAPSGVVWVCGACSSCLDVAWALWRMRPLPEAGAVLAVQQWAGRGQLRRSWHSPPGNLYVAWVWPCESGLFLKGSPDLLPIAAGLAVAAGLEAIGVSVALKWPNDLIWYGRKIGGLLVEERSGSILVGIGINLVMMPQLGLLEEACAVPAGTLAGAGVLLGKGPLSCWMLLAANACRFYKDVLHQMTVSSLLRLVAVRLV